VNHRAQVGVHDQITRELLLQLTGGSDPEWGEAEKAQALNLLASQSERSREKLLQIGNIVFGYRLLDVFVQLLGPSEEGEPLVVTRAPRPLSTSRRVYEASLSCTLLTLIQMLTLPKIYDSLKNWPGILTSFCNLHKQHSADHTADGMVVPSGLNGVQMQFIAGLNCLAAACRHRENVKYSKILGNVLVMACCVWWIGMVRELQFFDVLSF